MSTASVWNAFDFSDDDRLRGDNALLTACILRAVDMIPRLLEAGADLEATNRLGATPLVYVCRLGAGYANTVTATPAHTDGSTEERAITAQEVRASYLEVLRLLIAQGARLDARDPGGFAALHHAAESGNADFARALLEAGADASAADIDGFTPLHVAALKGDAAMARLLLAHGARREAAVTTAWKDVAAGMTPAGIATRRGHAELAALLARTE